MYLGHQYPVLKSPRLHMRQMTAGDTQKVYEGLSDKKVIRYYGVSYQSLTATEAQMEWYEELWMQKTGLWWAVCDRETKAFLGACGFNYYKPELKQAEVGYWLLPQYWGKGYASEALQTAMDFILRETDVERVEAYIERGNNDSDKLLKKHGFVQERIMENCELKNDKWITLLLFAFRKPEV